MAEGLEGFSTFRQQIHSHQPLLGTLITLASPEAAEILACVGYDWLFIDLEHSPMSAFQAQALLQAVAGRTPCLVRVEAADEAGIRKALDIGAQGIIVPQVNSSEAAARVVSWAKYPPRGVRGVGLARAHGYGFSFQDYINRANDELVVVIQVEHILAVENITAILDVPDIDAVLVGPYDLSCSLGKPGAVDDPVVQSAIDKVLQVCHNQGIPVGIFAASSQVGRKYLQAGFSLLAVGSDALSLGRAAAMDLEELRKSIPG